MLWDKPPDRIESYQKWLKEVLRVEISRITKNYYEQVVPRMRESFEESEFWAELIGQLSEFDAGFKLTSHGSPLLANTEQPLTLKDKPFSSVLLKSFRKNVLENALWPNAPAEGWYLPDNWLTKINDLVRTTIEVRYLDGIIYLADQVEELANAHGLPHKTDLEAKAEGYYAAHLYITHTSEVPKLTWDTHMIESQVEIQIRTGVQELIRDLLRQYYEKTRSQSLADGPKWQWDYTSDRFKASYLGHMVHYVEGAIVEIRNRQQETS